MSFHLHQKQRYLLSPKAYQQWGHLQPPSQQTLERKYPKIKSVHIRKMYTKKYGSLQGGRGVFACQNARTGSIVGITIEGLYYHSSEIDKIEKLHNWTHVREYSISFDMPDKKNSVSGLGEWNYIDKINSVVMTCNDGQYGMFKDKQSQVNAVFIPRFINDFPFIFIHMTKTIFKSEQIFVSYGELWWKVIVTCSNCNEKMNRQIFITHKCN